MPEQHGKQPSGVVLGNRCVRWFLVIVGVWLLVVQAFTVLHVARQISDLVPSDGSLLLHDDPSAWVARLQLSAQGGVSADLGFWPSLAGLGALLSAFALGRRRKWLRRALSAAGVVGIVGGLGGAWISFPRSGDLVRACHVDRLLGLNGISAFSSEQGAVWAASIAQGRPDWADLQGELYAEYKRSISWQEHMQFRSRRYIRFLLWPTQSERLPGE